MATKSTRIAITLPDVILKELDWACDYNCISRSDIIKFALVEYLGIKIEQEEEKCLSSLNS